MSVRPGHAHGLTTSENRIRLEPSNTPPPRMLTLLATYLTVVAGSI